MVSTTQRGERGREEGRGRRRGREGHTLTALVCTSSHLQTSNEISISKEVRAELPTESHQEGALCGPGWGWGGALTHGHGPVPPPWTAHPGTSLPIPWTPYLTNDSGQTRSKVTQLAETSPQTFVKAP